MNGNDTRHVRLWMLLAVIGGLLGGHHPAHADGIVHKSPPVPVTFGVRALTPDLPIAPQVPFVSQTVVLPPVACSTCTDQDTWTRHWVTSAVTLDRGNTRTEQGWYLFNSGLKGIGIGVSASPKLQPSATGNGATLPESDELVVGLVRTGQDTGAGLAALPSADFSRVTTFYGPDGQVKYAQEDTFQVSADFRVPTCTSSASSLSMALPDIDRGWLRKNVSPGHYTDAMGAAPQLVVANCSANTHTLRIRFIPAGSVADSDAGTATVLVGRDEDAQDTGVGFLMTYDAEGFGRQEHGVVHWDRNQPLVLVNPSPAESDGSLNNGISVSLQAFYARPDNGLPLSAGDITAKGLYQVSYD